MEGISISDSNLTALTGSYPGKRDTQHDPDVCPRCGAHRSELKSQLAGGATVIISCLECRNAIRTWYEKTKETRNANAELN